MRLPLLAFALVLSACSSSQEPSHAPPDEVPPSITMALPAPGSSVAGMVTVTATAADNRGVAFVQFKLDGEDLGSKDRTAPYSADWNTTYGPNVAHTLSALVQDIDGNVSAANTVTVTVNNALTASLQVRVVTTGADLDPDGYTVTMGAITLPIAINGSATGHDLPTGLVPVRLTGLAENCTVVGYALVMGTVSVAGEVPQVFYVRCASLAAPTERIVWRRQSVVDAPGYALFASNGDGTGRSLFHAADDEYPEWSQDRQNVSFQADLDLSGIWWTNAIGESRTLVVFSSTATRPSTSPDGTARAYVTSDGGVWLTGNGIAATRLTDGDRPAWAPNADSILFVRGADTWIMDRSGANPRRLISNATSPRWSPNGSRILFWRNVGGVGSYWIANANGTGEVMVVQGAALTDDGASWSPNGRQFVYVSTTGSTSNLWVINTDGSGAHNITNASDEVNVQPTWFR